MVKIRPGVQPGQSCEKKSITRTGQDRTTKKSQKRNISHILGKAPRKNTAMKFGTGVDVLEVVTWAEFVWAIHSSTTCDSASKYGVTLKTGLGVVQIH